MKKLLLLLVCSLWFTLKVSATCSPGYSEIIVSIVPDAFPTDITWTLTDSSGTAIASNGAVGDTICIPSGSCHTFTIYDSFGDGFNTPGGYWLYVDGNLVANGGNFGFQATYSLNCPAGMHCTSAIPITDGSYSAPFDDTWYSYTPAVSGTYNISTCNNNTCDTKVWVYSTCPAQPYAEGPPGSYAYNDDNNCGTQANLDVIFVANITYFIRIGDNMDQCSGPINFDLSYVGPISGCMDPNACNYNPAATVDDGSCIYNGNPGCAGPDLQLDSIAFLNSLGIQSQVAGTCDIDEGCVTGYGTRYVISFTSKINNIGSLDFYIGDPSSNPGMFNTNNCHGHAHYEGYGDYRLFDSNGNLVPAGHKNGFCVMDLCGFGQYNCGMMGISVGCYDAYGAGTQCQWLDITDVPEGDYRIAAIINSHHLPDAMGHYETNYLNNALQV
ncbi:MAG TPA: lysyl oxidase family protein, partial [Bacteroidia bacterium]|nr:lysyl oxidase family protein [Bacteroidia bacterium]